MLSLLLAFKCGCHLEWLQGNTADDKRFVFRSPTKEPGAYFTSANESGSNVPPRIPQPPPPPTTIRSADAVTPARRIVVIRHPKNPQVNQTAVDLSEFERPNSVNVAPVASDGHKSVYLIRRPIVPPDLPQSVDFFEAPQEQPKQPSPVTSLQYLRTPTPPPKEIITSPNPSRSPSPRQSPPLRPKTSKRPENSHRFVPYLKRPGSKPRTPSPVRTNSTRRSPSPNRARPVSLQRHSPSPPRLQLEEPKEEASRQRGCCSCLSKKKTTKPNSPPLHPVTVENEQRTAQYRQTPAPKSSQQRKSTGSRGKSAKSVVFVNPDDHSIAIVENSYVKGEQLRPVIKYSKSIKKTRFDDETADESTEKLVKTSRPQKCLSCLSRHMCLVVIICFILVLIGLAGVGVSAYFLAIDSTTNLTAKIVGVAVGGVLAIAAICFLYILLACIGSRDGYFSYNDKDRHFGGRAFALIPPSHPNARLYIPRDYMQMVENNHPPPMTRVPTAPASNFVYGRSSPATPLSTIPYTQQQQTTYRSNTSTNGFENKSNKNNITIEMPERLLTGREMSPRSRERSLNKVVKNIGHVVEDAKKRYHGDVPNKVIVKVDRHAMQTA